MIRTLLLLFATAVLGSAQFLVSIGDSTGAGVQSADASVATQVKAYSKLVANQAGATHPLPLIWSNPLGVVYSTAGRFRLNPATPPGNLAVSGADLGTALRLRPTLPLDSEIDLILTPFSGSQVEIAELIGAEMTLCWIGGNDALSAVLTFDQLDASQLTSVSDFETDFREIAQRLTAASGKVIFLNIPSLPSIAYSMDADDLTAYAGSSFSLPAGHFTTLVTATALRTGLLDGSILSNPNFVLDPSEVAIIQQRIDAFNAIIATEAAAVGAPVVDVSAYFDALDQNGLSLFGIPLTTGFLGGLFSLDGVHPSNIGHAVIANEIIRTSNSFYGTTIAQIGPIQLLLTLFSDPFVDKDGDGKVIGRPLAGLLETLAPAIGISGDTDDFNPDPPFIASTSAGRAFVTQTESLTGINSPTKSLGQRALAASAAALNLQP